MSCQCKNYQIHCLVVLKAKEEPGLRPSPPTLQAPSMAMRTFCSILTRPGNRNYLQQHCNLYQWHYLAISWYHISSKRNAWPKTYQYVTITRGGECALLGGAAGGAGQRHINAPVIAPGGRRSMALGSPRQISAASVPSLINSSPSSALGWIASIPSFLPVGTSENILGILMILFMDHFVFFLPINFSVYSFFLEKL